MYTLCLYAMFICAGLPQLMVHAATVQESEQKHKAGIEQREFSQTTTDLPLLSSLQLSTMTPPSLEMAEKEETEKVVASLTTSEISLPKDTLHEPRCTNSLTGSMNLSSICYLNTALQLLYEMTCNKNIWDYIQKARPTKRLIPLRKALLNFITHYDEPRVIWIEDAQEYEAGSGQKWVDAVAAELFKLKISHFAINAGGSEYLAILYMLEALMGGSVNMNFALQHTKEFKAPIGLLLSTTFYKYAPDFDDKDALEKFTKQLLALPGDTWLERALAYQAQNEKMKYRCSQWPKFILIIDYDASPSDTSDTIQENTQEEIESFKIGAQFASFPLTLNLQKLGLCSDSILYSCRGISLGSLDHAMGLIKHNSGSWLWVDDAYVESDENVERMVKEISTGGKTSLPEENSDEEIFSPTIYMYERIS